MHLSIFLTMYCLTQKSSQLYFTLIAACSDLAIGSFTLRIVCATSAAGQGPHSGILQERTAGEGFSASCILSSPFLNGRECAKEKTFSFFSFCPLNPHNDRSKDSESGTECSSAVCSEPTTFSLVNSQTKRHQMTVRTPTDPESHSGGSGGMEGYPLW